MIDHKQFPVAWALLVSELEEAHEHLGELIGQLGAEGALDDSEYAVHLGHVFAHLNRAWHSRNLTTQITSEQWPTFSQFPKDVAPLG